MEPSDFSNQDTAYWGRKWDYFWCRDMQRNPQYWVFQEDCPPGYCFMDKESIDGKTVLEIGCGVGMRACEVALLSKKYYGIDISRLALTIAETVCPKKTEFRLIQTPQDIWNLTGVLWQSVDTVFAKDVFIHLGKQRIVEYLKFAKEILRPGGILYADFFYMTSEDRLKQMSVIPTDKSEADGAVFLYQKWELNVMLNGFEILSWDETDEKSPRGPRLVLKARKQ